MFEEVYVKAMMERNNEEEGGMHVEEINHGDCICPRQKVVFCMNIIILTSLRKCVKNQIIGIFV